MRKAKEIKEDLISALATVSDERFLKMGFKRNRRSLDYKRTIMETNHIINIHRIFHPKYYPNDELKIYPQMEIHMNSIAEISAELFEGNQFLSSTTPGFIAWQPIDWLRPNRETINWIATGIEEMQRELVKICDFVEEYVAPFIDKMITPKDLIDYYKSDNRKITRTETWHLAVVAAYIKEKDLLGAQEVLKKNLGKLGMRMQYASVFEKLGIDPELDKLDLSK